ncbi:GAF domain-containing protein [Williamsia sp. MIQD14]|uniref:GAF domain-containing protein n=1 Tax=Williamsia sp. MIQD14 TaxID=3425703 RepID=UPI003DA045F6
MTRPDGDHGPPAVYRAPMIGGANRALRLGVCGMSASDERGMRRVERFERVADGAFVWTRTDDGEFFLGRIDGPLREDHTDDATATGLMYCRPCRWTPTPVPEHEVPAATLRTFARGGRNFQQTHDPDVSDQSATVWRTRGT